MDFFLQEINKASLTIEYEDSAEFFAITAESNIADIAKLKKYFTRRNFSETKDNVTPVKTDNNETLSAYAISILDKDYIKILKEIDAICKKRYEEFCALTEMSPNDEEYKRINFKSDNLIEILSFRRFLNKYLDVTEKSEFQKFTYYSLFVD